MYLKSILITFWVPVIVLILKILSKSILPNIGHQGSLRKSGGFTPNGGAKYKGGSNFRPICGYISEMVIERGMEDEYKVVCALSNSAAFDKLQWPEPQFQGHSIV